MLKEYYGTVDASGGAGSSTSSSSSPQKKQPKNKLRGNVLVPNSKPDPLHLDNQAFSGELYLNKYLYEVSLADLIRRDNDLILEIKELDGDMKTLVYENYNKFISATDMIRRMKSNVENMEMEMAKLAANIEKISNCSEGISDSFAERRNKIHQLGGVSNLLKKLNFVFELPPRLQQCYKQQSYIQAVKYYSRVSHLLNHYGHLTMFKKITEESRSVINDVAKRVKEKLYREHASVSEVSECIGLLVGLADQSGPELAKLHLSMADKQFSKTIQKGIAVLEAMTVDSFSTRRNSMFGSPTRSSVSSDLPKDMALVVEKTAHLNRTLLMDLADMVDCFDSFFLNTGITTFSPNSKISVSASADSTSKVVPFSVKLDPKEYVEAAQMLDEFIQKILEKYFEIIDELLKIPDDLSKLPALSYVHVLKCIQTDVSTLESLKEHAQIDKRVANMTHEWITRIVEAVFDKALMEFMEKFKNIEEKSPDELERLVRTSTSFLEDALMRDCLPIFENFIQAGSSPTLRASAIAQGLAEMIHQIKSGFQQFWHRLFDKMMDITSRKRAKPGTGPLRAPPVLTLTLSKVAAELSKSVIEPVYARYAEQVLEPNYEEKKAAAASAMEKQHLAVKGVGGGGGSSSSSKSGGKQQAGGGTTSNKMNPMVVVTAGGGTYGYTGRSGARSHHSLNDLNAKDVGSYSSESESAAKSREISNLSKTYSQKLLRRFVSGLASDYCVSIRNYLRGHSNIWFGNPVAGRDPDQLSPCWSDFMKSLIVYEARVRKLYDDGSLEKRLKAKDADKKRVASTGPGSLVGGRNNNQHHPHLKRGGDHPSSGTNFDALLSNIDKLFAEKVEYFGDVEMGRAAIMNAIVKIVIKCFIEEVRQLTLDSSGFKQVQADVELVKNFMWIYSADDQFMGSMVEEALLSAYRRCVDPQSLDPQVSTALISEFESSSDILIPV